MTPLRFCVIALIVLLASVWGHAAASAQDRTKPNIVILLVDDAALMDFGVYGGEAHTPHIDALATRGAMFTQYRTSPLCSPSRAMLLTGMDNHLTGISTIPEVLPKEHVGQPGYSMSLEPGVLTLADRLRPFGYRTLMTGKWHMGSSKGDLPVDHGFDRSFALDASGADNWEDKSYMPFYDEAPWFEGSDEVELPDNFYSSQFIVDKMIEYIKGGDQAKPFMAFLGFQAIHIPLQAPKDIIEKYDGVYDDGWHALRAKRHERAMALGLFDEGAPIAPMLETAREWTSLSDEDRVLYAKRMQVNAAMMEAMDHHIGRLIEYLKTEGQYENTIFVVTSDNGPEHNRGDNDRRLSFWMWLNDYHVGLEGMGGPGSWAFIGPEWANAAASPGAMYKFYMAEGGIRAPFIMAGPGIAPQKVNAMAMVSDVAPTLIEMIEPDAAKVEGKSMTGRSLLPVLRGEVPEVYTSDEPIGMEVSGNSALYKGDYKISRAMPPVGDGEWKLYNVAQDPGETRDLSSELSEIKAELEADYAVYAARMGVLEMPEGYNSTRQVLKNSMQKMYQKYMWLLMLLGAVATLLLYWLLRRLRRLIFKT